MSKDEGATKRTKRTLNRVLWCVFLALFLGGGLVTAWVLRREESAFSWPVAVVWDAVALLGAAVLYARSRRKGSVAPVLWLVGMAVTFVVGVYIGGWLIALPAAA